MISTAEVAGEEMIVWMIEHMVPTKLERNRNQEGNDCRWRKRREAKRLMIYLKSRSKHSGSGIKRVEAGRKDMHLQN